MRHKILLSILTLVIATGLAFDTRAAEVIVYNFDGPGIGFNDPTPVAPVGGNNGLTLGQQRLNVFQEAATAWGAELESEVPIGVIASFAPLPCGPTGGVLGGAGAWWLIWNFPNAPLTDTLYASALADALAGSNLAPDDFDIFAVFNGDIGVNPNCLTGLNWYNGFDHNEAPNEIDLLTVVMHEFAHGLGFFETVSEGTGAKLIGLDDAYQVHMFDTTQQKYWTDMTDAERLQSQVNSGNLVWTGQNVTDEAPNVLGARASVRVPWPRDIRGIYEAQEASFGPPLPFNAYAEEMEIAQDGVGVSTDACEPLLYPWVFWGKVVLVDRGGCAFTTKVLNAQAARAKSVIVINNQPKGLPPMGGFAPGIYTPSVGVSMADGMIFKDGVARGVVGSVYKDSRFLAGANPDGYVRLYAPDPVQPGSSKSHFDTVASPNLLMEPSINSDLEPTNDLDLTIPLMKDIGWTATEEEVDEWPPWWPWPF